MKFKYQIKSTLVSPVKHRKLMNDINRETGNYHKDVTLPQHFEEGAENKYHYGKRRDRYLKKKKALYHHQRPLVYTGLLFNYLMQKSKVTAAYDRWRIYCKAPFPMREQLRSEVERINKSEISAYKKQMKQKYVKRAPAMGQMKKVEG